MSRPAIVFIGFMGAGKSTALAVGGEVVLDRGADALLELAVGVDGAHAERGGGGAGAGRLAGAHEANKNEGGPQGLAGRPRTRKRGREASGCDERVRAKAEEAAIIP